MHKTTQKDTFSFRQLESITTSRGTFVLGYSRDSFKPYVTLEIVTPKFSYDKRFFRTRTAARLDLQRRAFHSDVLTRRPLNTETQTNLSISPKVATAEESELEQ